ncbi:MAG: tetratricopeptide repeat protein [Sandarakinorhabdus sp.]|nr:tetratricopeptide repeat protein [Sandarakinorhabdus sp.]
MRIPLFLFVAVTAGAATARPTQPPPAESALHGYVLGRYASAEDELSRASRYFDAARLQEPDRLSLIRRTFDVAVAAGDRPLAIDLARQLAIAGQIDSDVSMMRLVDAVLKRDWNAADSARAGIASAGYAIVVGPIVEAWTLFGRGKTEQALAKLDPAGFSGFARSYIAEQRAHMLAASGRWQEAAALYSELRIGSAGGITLLRQGEADALAQGGDKAAALKLLEGSDPMVVAARQRLQSGKRIGALAPDPRRGIGWMAARLASDLSRDKPVPLALMFARVGTFLAPDISATWLINGDVLGRGGQRETALLAYDRVPAGDPLQPTAKARRAGVLEAMGRSADAGAIWQAAANAPGASVDDWTRLGDWHRRGDRFADAIAAYGKAIALAGPANGDWGLYFLRGSMNDRAGNWAAAQADLREALYRSPDEPTVLNYLGYSLLERGESITEAAALIERAAKMRPGDGGAIDSLGWSQYRQGRFAEAVATLEKAAALEPTDPVVTDHLGDAYWRVGRRIDARFRWRAALDLDPDAKQKKAMPAKLEYGLDAALAMAPEPGAGDRR